ncbi:SH3 domain-containing protein [Phormidium sp. LEGE 05292]|uniref:SH3 domain-containing protein n=1 Tax=[Phormidium] sp. LEGE 05292 TaxID=767427 RepID=UPI00187DF081|nr:SH3 domain-containing protein [Phormidium sp. LEGE 05292]MBE9228830.1 SH3 domain-containing protein [Phormidium sp. LEGE 05292]
MTNSKNFINSLVTIPILSLSMMGVNLPAIAIPKNTQAQLIAQQTTCSVANIQTGQLALRFTPNGQSKAGLDNGNTVALVRKGPNPWVYVRVLAGPNSRVNDLQGWVNSNYLSCSGASSQNTSGACEVVGIETGQLALRFTPNGRSKAGLNNGNTVSLIRAGADPWVYVRVVRGPNGSVNGLEGWVNSNYLNCGD